MRGSAEAGWLKVIANLETLLATRSSGPRAGSPIGRLATIVQHEIDAWRASVIDQRPLPGRARHYCSAG
jgi:hypothetical protein